MLENFYKLFLTDIFAETNTRPFDVVCIHVEADAVEMLVDLREVFAGLINGTFTKSSRLRRFAIMQESAVHPQRSMQSQVSYTSVTIRSSLGGYGSILHRVSVLVRKSRDFYPCTSLCSSRRLVPVSSVLIESSSKAILRHELKCGKKLEVDERHRSQTSPLYLDGVPEACDDRNGA